MVALSLAPLAPRAVKALFSCASFFCRPDPSRPILSSRAKVRSTGFGYYRAKSGRGKSRGKSSASFLAKSTAYTLPLPYYRENRPLTCVRVRLRAHVHGTVCFSGSTVVDTSKTLKDKAKCPYFCPYFAPTAAVVSGSGMVNPLKLFKKGEI